MRRALQLAVTSPFYTHPNPMVGAVIVCDGRIIGEGYHRRCGEAHAEVNAIASVKERGLLKRSTIYVTLEPCSHYGKTPPCAELIIESGIPRVVIGTSDPFGKVAGRGIGMLREAGIEVITGVLAEESREINRHFFTAHTSGRPFVTLKWAMSADRFMDIKRSATDPAAKFSTPATKLLTHRLRACHDAILTTASTVMADNPHLDVRGWQGPSPRRIVIDRKGIVPVDAEIFGSAGETTLLYSKSRSDYPAADIVTIPDNYPISLLLKDLYLRGTTSLLVEAGPRFLKSFIDSGLWDDIRIESAPFFLGERGTAPAPEIPDGIIHTGHCGNNTFIYIRKRL